MPQYSDYIVHASKKEDNATYVATTSTFTSAGDFVKILDQHPTGGVLLLLIITAIAWYMGNRKR